jgi:hypothetical protein
MMREDGLAMTRITFVVAALSWLATQAAVTSGAQDTPAPVTAAQPAPTAVKGILVVQPFKLQQGYRNDWSKGREQVSSGVVVVLDVDPALAQRRDAAEPVLYAGDTPVQRLNDGGKSGRLIGIVPGATDLTNVPIWFGAPNLPERATVDTARAERARAERSGIRPLSTDALRTATRAPVTAPDLAALLRDHVAPLVLEFSPYEKDLADAWRLPAATASPKPPR